MSADWPTVRFDEIDSTSEEAKRRGRAGAFQDQWIIATRQTTGRGRLGRAWASPQGNLYATALFQWPRPVAEAVRIPFAAGLAVADTVAELVPGSDPRLKWPNDVRIRGAKLCGILVESGDGPQGRWVSVGIGLNVAFVPEGIGQAGTCLSELIDNRPLTTDDVHPVVRTHFANRLQEVQTAFADTRLAWLRQAEGLSEIVRVTLSGTPIEGRFEDLGPDGALLLRLPDGSLQTIRAGDVELVRDTGAG